MNRASLCAACAAIFFLASQQSAPGESETQGWPKWRGPNDNGVLVSRKAKTGELLIDQTRTPDITSVYASPVAANGYIYLTGRNGTTLVLKHGASFEVIATNKLEDEIDASAALVDNEIYFRGKQFLYRISERK